VAGRKQDDPPGLSQSVALKLGESNYVRPGEARNRWGDYMGLALDPSDPNAIWVHTEYAASPTNTWGNWIGLIKMDPLATSVVEEGSLKVPEQFALQQNYPNPFNPATTFEISVPERAFVRLSVHNILGEEVAVLLGGELPPGRHKVRWEPTGFSSGVYFGRFTVHGESGVTYSETLKTVLLR
ncbi:MAG: hypothetical protein WBG80_03480, partial [Bacteroidota bacterium]